MSKQNGLRALDLFCKAGGATKGLQLAGFHVTGVDLEVQPHYCGNAFFQADALEYPLDGFDFIWASPPCQKYTRMTQGLLESQGRGREYPDLVPLVRERLRSQGVPYVIENVVGAPLEYPVMLCGSSFGLLVERHRIFESSFPMLVPQCAHFNQVKDKPSLHRSQGVSRVVGCYGYGRGKGDTVDLWKKAMGIDWMNRRELSQAVPPAYSRYIGEQFLKVVTN
jgi:DNA (cytosine-5)-methyltransferase 1